MALLHLFSIYHSSLRGLLARHGGISELRMKIWTKERFEEFVSLE